RHTRCYRDWSSDVCSSDLSRSAGPDFERGKPLVEEHGQPVDGTSAVVAGRSDQRSQGWIVKQIEDEVIRVQPVSREDQAVPVQRSEARRVGKEGRGRRGEC